MMCCSMIRQVHLDSLTQPFFNPEFVLILVLSPSAFDEKSDSYSLLTFVHADLRLLFSFFFVFFASFCG